MGGERTLGKNQGKVEGISECSWNVVMLVDRHNMSDFAILRTMPLASTMARMAPNSKSHQGKSFSGYGFGLARLGGEGGWRKIYDVAILTKRKCLEWHTEFSMSP